MRYDDRLKTVLGQAADRPHERAVRWRQLVELLARGGNQGALFDAALAEVEKDRETIDESVRMAAARAIAPLFVPTELVRVFASDRLSVAAPVLAAARLTAADWARVAAAASPDCRGFIATLQPGAESSPAFPPPPEPPEAARNSDAPANERVDRDEPTSESAIPSISEVVARIERLRKSRMAPSTRTGQQQGAPAPREFRWECDPAGDIRWADGVPRGAIIGRSIARGGDAGDIESCVERAFAMRLPFSDARLELAAGSVAGGSWKISGTPVFDSATGRFTGYHGVAQRDPGHEQLLARDPDSLRELAHELKTPLNAIIGFAEIISGQYFGPANAAYRERAEEIVGQARLLVAAIDDLDFAARLHGDPTIANAVALPDLIARVEPQFGDDKPAFTIETRDSIALDPLLAERLVLRFCKAVTAASGEAPHFMVRQNGGRVVVGAPAPKTESGTDNDLELRLVLGLARLSGSELREREGELELHLPRA